MRFCLYLILDLGLILGLAFVGSRAFAQEPASASGPAAASVAPASSPTPPAGAASTTATPTTNPPASSPPIRLVPDASGAVPQEQIRELLRYAQEKEFENEKRLRDYTYIEREEQHMLDGRGNVKKVETRTL